MNLSTIAQVCNCSTENVNQFLSKMREQITALCFKKGRQVCLNLPIGQLLFSPSKIVEFKSNCQAALLSMNEQYKSIDEYRVSRAYDKANEKPKSIKSRFAAKRKVEDDERKDLTHLSDFLKNQIMNRHNERKSQKSYDSKAFRTAQTQKTSVRDTMKYNNALIERASRDIHAKKSKACSINTSNLRNKEKQKDEITIGESKCTQASQFDLNKSRDPR